jgi:hypothetical protein
VAEECATPQTLSCGVVYDFRSPPDSGMGTPRLYAEIIDQVAWLDELDFDLARVVKFNSHLSPMEHACRRAYADRVGLHRNVLVPILVSAPQTPQVPPAPHSRLLAIPHRTPDG